MKLLLQDRSICLSICLENLITFRDHTGLSCVVQNNSLPVHIWQRLGLFFSRRKHSQQLIPTKQANPTRNGSTRRSEEGLWNDLSSCFDPAEVLDRMGRIHFAGWNTCKVLFPVKAATLTSFFPFFFFFK